MTAEQKTKRVRFLRTLEAFKSGQSRALVVDTETQQHYCVSSLEAAYDTGEPETLVFLCDPQGEFGPGTLNPRSESTAGGIGMDMEHALADLESVLSGAGSRGTVVPNVDLSPFDSFIGR